MQSLLWRSSVVGVFVCTLTCLAHAQQSPLPIPQASPANGTGILRSPEDIERDVKAYCRYITAVGNSAAMLLLSPSVFAEFSNIPLSAAVTGTASDSLARLELGASFSPTRMYRGFVTNDLAHAECRRYSAEAYTPPLPASPVTGRAALVAKLAVLEEAVKRGRDLRAALVKKLEESLATVEDYGALALQVDALEEQLNEVKTQLAALPPEVNASSPNAWAERVAAEDSAQRAQASLRRSEALNFEIRGGYYKIFGESERVPAFVIATLEFNPGWLWQSEPEARALEAHTSWIKTKSSTIGLAPEVREQLQQALRLDRDRLSVLDDTLADLEGRRASIEKVPGEQAKRFADVLWLELAKVRAEKAYLLGHAAELETVLHGDKKQAP